MKLVKHHNKSEEPKPKVNALSNERFMKRYARKMVRVRRYRQSASNMRDMVMQKELKANRLAEKAEFERKQELTAYQEMLVVEKNMLDNKLQEVLSLANQLPEVVNPDEGDSFRVVK